MTDAQLLKDLLPEITNRIELSPGQPVMARYLGPHRERMIELFHTDTIPTAFDSRQEREDVLQAIEKLNPGCLVYWKGTL